VGKALVGLASSDGGCCNFVEATDVGAAMADQRWGCWRDGQRHSVVAGLAWLTAIVEAGGLVAVGLTGSAARHCSA
jgi:hypothetical protein